MFEHFPQLKSALSFVSHKTIKKVAAKKLLQHSVALRYCLVVIFLPLLPRKSIKKIVIKGKALLLTDDCECLQITRRSP